MLYAIREYSIKILEKYMYFVWQVVLFCTAVASWITTIYMIDHKAHGTLNMGNFDVLYDKPWIRISPYLVGKTCLSTLSRYMILWCRSGRGGGGCQAQPPQAAAPLQIWQASSGGGGWLGRRHGTRPQVGNK